MIRNVHERTINAPAQALAPLLDGLGGDGDRLWPGEHWVPMVLDRPLAVGADGGHGAIRYRVVEYEPGRRVRFLFHPSTGIAGIHELSVEELGAQRCRVRHVLLGAGSREDAAPVPGARRAIARCRYRGPAGQRRAGGHRWGEAPCQAPGLGTGVVAP